MGYRENESIKNNNFEVKEKDEKIWIINHTSCHIDGEPFEYEQSNQDDAKLLCQELNQLLRYKISFSEIMGIIHNIKYGDWHWEDLEEYVYKGTSMNELWCKHDELCKMITKEKENQNE